MGITSSKEELCLRLCRILGRADRLGKARQTGSTLKQYAGGSLRLLRFCKQFLWVSNRISIWQVFFSAVLFLTVIASTDCFADCKSFKRYWSEQMRDHASD